MKIPSTYSRGSCTPPSCPQAEYPLNRRFPFTGSTDRALLNQSAVWPKACNKLLSEDKFSCSVKTLRKSDVNDNAHGHTVIEQGHKSWHRENWYDLHQNLKRKIRVTKQRTKSNLAKTMLFVLPRNIIQGAVIPAVTKNWRLTMRIARRRPGMNSCRRLTKLFKETGKWANQHKFYWHGPCTQQSIPV